jgi:ABC-2 type transport system ATP-binding protein
LRRADSALRETIFQLLTIIGTLPAAVVGGNDGAAKLLEQHDTVALVEPGDGQMRVTLKEGVLDFSELSVELLNAGHKLTKFAEEEVSLESAFMALTKGVGAKI